MKIKNLLYIATYISVVAWISSTIYLKYPVFFEVYFYISSILFTVWFLDNIYHTFRLRRSIKKLKRHATKYLEEVLR